MSRTAFVEALRNEGAETESLLIGTGADIGMTAEVAKLEMLENRIFPKSRDDCRDVEAGMEEEEEEAAGVAVFFWDTAESNPVSRNISENT